MQNHELLEISKEVRRNIIKMLGAAKSGHAGGSLSMVELLVALYYKKMNFNMKYPQWEERDRLVLSKGHGAPGLYAVLAEKGFFPKEELTTLRKLHSNLQGHPDMRKTPGVDACTGSLGQGISIAVGMALGARLKKINYKVYTILGDGELQEGQVWEACMSAAHYKLDNFTAILDYNGLQIDGTNDEVMSLGNVKGKFEAFGYEVFEVDGHNFDEILQALDIRVTGRPKCILAKTIKGKGISFMENNVGWHGKAPDEEQVKKALMELED
ncbi:MAG: transketolase [Clostridiales bacterium GWC2_40_7]|nr:MAG: transketolase [Clostridiales bacterium GWC2_40_7]